MAIHANLNRNQTGRREHMRILLVEDDADLNHNLTYYLTQEGYTVDSCFDGEEALYYCKEQQPDMILLDRMLPLLSGTELLKTIRAQGIHVPVLILTAMGTLNDRIEGLDLGADDYLVKPFAVEELGARIRSLLRRSTPTASFTGDTLCYLDLTLYPRTGELSTSSGTVTLSKREYALLEVFLRNPGQTLSRGQLLSKVWGMDGEVEDGNLDNYIFFLRRRLKNLNSGAVITTIRGIGYRMEERTDRP